MSMFCMAVHRWGSGCPGAMLDPTISSRNSDGVDGRAPSDRELWHRLAMAPRRRRQERPASVGSTKYAGNEDLPRALQAEHRVSA